MLSFPAPSWQTSVVPRTRSLPRDPKQRVATQIMPRLYLTDYATANDEEILKKLGITHILSVLEAKPSFAEELHLITMHVPVADRAEADLLSRFEETTAFITDALVASPDNKVLVHCLQGISRSAAVVCAYLLSSTEMIAAETIAFCQAKRGIVCPNIGFRRQLDEYAKQFYSGHRKKVKNSSPSAIPLFRMGSGVTERIKKLRESNFSKSKESQVSTLTRDSQGG